MASVNLWRILSSSKISATLHSGPEDAGNSTPEV